MEWPKCITAERRGLGESEYAADGELAPVTWYCGCGSFLVIERCGAETKANFLQKHSNCKSTCFKCREVEVDHPHGWCESCEDKYWEL